MKKLALAVTMILAAFSAQAADNIAAPEAGRDWGGVYAGLKYVRGMRGGWDVTNAGVVFNQGTQQAGNMFGGFVGYNVQRGHLVYGGELAAQFGKFAMTGFPNSVYTNFIDLKARVGYATDRVLVFGAIGGMVGHFDDGPAIDFTLAGLTLGAGVDVMVTDKVFIGGEVTHRIFRGDDATRPLIDWHANSTEVSLRAGVRF